jgi:hypothetical protein
LYISKVLKVLYAPRRTLKEIIETPRYIGPLLVIILLIAANLGTTYIALSKNYYEQTLPNGEKHDEWTENSTFWMSNAQVTESSDCINQTYYYGIYYYGNASIEFSTTNSSSVWMQLNGIGSVNCSALGSYNLLSFRTKWTSPDATPENVTLQMLSANTSDYFFRDLNDSFKNASSNVWNNITVTLASSEWSETSSSADWGNITGLELNLTWATSSNTTLLVDGLFFHGPFQSALETGGPGYLLSNGIGAAFQFAITWVLLSGLVYGLVRALRGKSTWRPILIAVGFILIIMIVQTLISAIGYLMWPVAHIPFELLGGVNAEGDAALKTITDQRWLSSQIAQYAGILAAMWIIALVAVAVRLLAEFSWIKSIMVGILAYVVTILIVSFIA